MNYKLHQSSNLGEKVSDITPILESNMMKEWASLKPCSLLIDRDGNRITIFSPGRLNKNEGPDFLDAIIWVKGKMVKGAVELHVHESNWVSHGHQNNLRYKDVILHVVNSFSKKPILNIPTVQLIHQSVKPYQCPIPNQQFHSSQINILMELGLKRWEEKVALFSNKNHRLTEIYLSESLANFGSGENRKLYRALGQQVFPVLKNKIKREEWIIYFLKVSKSFQWHRGGSMPARYPEKIMKKVGCLCFDLFSDEGQSYTVQDLKQLFLNYGFGQTSWVEWCGNVHFPFMAGESLQNYTVYLKYWTSLQLPKAYGELKRFFRNRLLNTELKSFPLAQGLLYLKKHYCAGWACQICKVKRSL